MGEKSNEQPPKKDNFNETEDCFSCKVTGTLTMCGLGAYTLFERQKMKISDRRGRAIYAIFSSLLFATGAYRAAM